VTAAWIALRTQGGHCVAHWPALIATANTSPARSTRRLCPPNLADDERALLLNKPGRRGSGDRGIKLGALDLLRTRFQYRPHVTFTAFHAPVPPHRAALRNPRRKCDRRIAGEPQCRTGDGISSPAASSPLPTSRLAQPEMTARPSDPTEARPRAVTDTARVILNGGRVPASITSIARRLYQIRSSRKSDNASFNARSAQIAADTQIRFNSCDTARRQRRPHPDKRRLAILPPHD